ncbi:MAG: hypothetical protein WAM66_02075 [Acidobacteriaceae bacterium]
MKKLALVAAASMLLPMLSFAKAPERSYKGQIFDMACAKSGSHDAGYKMTGTHTPKDCTLACNKAGSPLVLYNKATNIIYKLDDQSEAKKFAGENVKVKGTLDSSTETIHVARMTK